MLLSNHVKKASPVIPNAPDVKNPAAARPMASAAGTRTRLKRMKSGAATVSPKRVPARVRPASRRRTPPSGRSVTTTRTWAVQGPLSEKRSPEHLGRGGQGLLAVGAALELLRLVVLRHLVAGGARRCFDRVDQVARVIVRCRRLVRRRGESVVEHYKEGGEVDTWMFLTRGIV